MQIRSCYWPPAIATATAGIVRYGVQVNSSAMMQNCYSFLQMDGLFIFTGISPKGYLLHPLNPSSSAFVFEALLLLLGLPVLLVFMKFVEFEALGERSARHHAGMLLSCSISYQRFPYRSLSASWSPCKSLSESLIRFVIVVISSFENRWTMNILTIGLLSR